MGERPWGASSSIRAMKTSKQSRFRDSFRGSPDFQEQGKGGNDLNRFHVLSSVDYEVCFPSLPGVISKAPIKEVRSAGNFCEPCGVTTSTDPVSDWVEEGRRLEKLTVAALNRAKKGRSKFSQEEIDNLESWLARYRASFDQSAFVAPVVGHDKRAKAQMPDRMALSESKEAQVSGVDNVKVGMVASSAEAVGGVDSLDQSTIVDFSSPEMSPIPSPVCSMVDDPKGILDSAGIQVEEKGGDSRAPQVLDKLPTQIFSETPNVKNNTVTQASILFLNRGDRNPGLKEKLEKRVPTSVATEESEVKPRCSDKAEGVAAVSEVAAQMIQMISEATESGAETGGKEFDFEGEGTECGEDVEAENIGQSAPVAREAVAGGEVEAGDTKGEAESRDSEIDNDASSFSESGCSVEDEDDEGISDPEQESAKDNVAIQGTCKTPHPTQICSKNKSA
ncbi:hypothetical protein U1Q18_046004, partial [Sarracenia purpurea var. burkii]